MRKIFLKKIEKIEDKINGRNKRDTMKHKQERSRGRCGKNWILFFAHLP